MRKALIVLVVLVVLGASTYGGRHAYRKWKVHHDLELARNALKAADYKNASLWVRKALSKNANEPEALQMMADIAETFRSENTVYWRERLVQIQPENWSNRLALARTALSLGQTEAAKRALDGIPEPHRNNAEVHGLMGSLASVTKQFAEAEQHFAQAIQLAPTDPLPALNLAVIRIQRKETNLANEARQILEKLRTNTTVGTIALRHLVDDSRRQTNILQTLSLVRDLMTRSNLAIGDRLTELEVLRLANRPEFPSKLQTLQAEASTNPSQAFVLGSWMSKEISSSAALSWLETIPPDIRTNPPVTLIVADSYCAMTNWTALDQWVSKQEWGDFDSLRHAFSARALRELGLGLASKAAWSKAMKTTQAELDRLDGLRRVVARWNWRQEEEEVLWEISTKFPREREAAEALMNHLFAGGKTRSLMTLIAQEMKNRPSDLDVKNNLASLSLLLDAKEYRPHELAMDLHRTQPNNPHYSSTYAFSLFLQGQRTEALKLMETLPPEFLGRPTIAGYYGVFLASDGQTEKAEKYLSLSRSARVLPEERQLFGRATSRN